MPHASPGLSEMGDGDNVLTYVAPPSFVGTAIVNIKTHEQTEDLLLSLSHILTLTLTLTRTLSLFLILTQGN